jgi:hypothetical protein
MRRWLPHPSLLATVGVIALAVLVGKILDVAVRIASWLEG